MASDLTWHKVDSDSLKPETFALYDALVEANKAAGKAREAFEKAFLAGQTAPKGFEWKVSTRFGGIAVALAPKGKAKSGTGTAENVFALAAKATKAA